MALPLTPDQIRDLPPSGLTPVAAAILADLADRAAPGAFRFVATLDDLPPAVDGVITLADAATYFIAGTLDLNGARLVAGVNTVIIGGSSENSLLKSTGLGAMPLISSDYTLPIRFIAIEADLALDLDGARGGQPAPALDWNGVNFVNCASVGAIANYTNAIILNSAFLDSGGLTFDGVIGTVGFDGCLFSPTVGQTAVILPPTASITRRLRVIYSAAVILPGAGGFDVQDAASIVGDESFILDTVSFGGGGNYLPGVSTASNKALFTTCVGIPNTAVNGQMFMRGNAVATVIPETTGFYKVAGATTASPDNAKYDHADNRLTNRARIIRKYQITVTLSFNAGNGNQCELGIYDSTLGAVRDPSTTRATANAAGRAESVTMTCVIQHSDGDFIEIHARNTSAAVNITVTDLNVVITEIK